MRTRWRFQKRSSGVLAAVLLVTLLAGCAGPVPNGSNRESRPAVRIAALKGPTGVGLVHLMAAQENRTTSNDYTFAVSDAPDGVVAKIASGEVDVAAVPTNLAAALYAKTSGGVQMLAVNTLNAMYVLENGDSVGTIADLKGKTVYATGQGSNPEYVLRFLLKRNGLDPDRDLDLTFRSEHAELATLVAKGEAKIALLPEPFVTTVTAKNPQVRVALDLGDQWANTVTDGSRLMMGAIIARTAFAQQNPAAVATFLAEYRRSVERAKSDPASTGTLSEQFGIIPDANLAKLAVPRLGLTFISGEEMVSGVQGYYRVLYDADPASLGGALPDAGFYYRG